MQFVHTKADEPLEELAARAYSFKGKESKASLRSAGKTLREANPFLRRLSEVPDGTLLIVPPLEEAEPAADTEPLAGAAGALVAARLREAADAAVELLGAELDQEVADTRSSLDVLSSPEVRRLVRADDQAKLVYEATQAAAKARLAAAGQLGDYRGQVAKRVEQDLDELIAALRIGGGA
jgi:hypothetical protein